MRVNNIIDNGDEVIYADVDDVTYGLADDDTLIQYDSNHNGTNCDCVDGDSVRRYSEVIEAIKNVTNFTASDKQLIKNAIQLAIKKGRAPKPRLVAFIENDVEFIKAFDERVAACNASSEESGLRSHVYFYEQIRWDMDAYREVQEIREFEV